MTKHLSFLSLNELPIVPGRGLVNRLATDYRLDFLEAKKIDIPCIKDTDIDLQSIQHNIESFIGTTEIPLGVVGPLLFKDDEKEELVYTAAGTLEGALIASMNRGARAMGLSGGFKAKIKWQKMCRVPMFLFENIQDADLFNIFYKSKFQDVQQLIKQYSNHAHLLEIKSTRIDHAVHLKFIYSTGDASGQNMSTTCTWHAMLYLVDEFKKQHNIIPVDFVIEGNGSGDKKVTHSNIQSGRGIHTTATCLLSNKVLHEVLRTSSDKMMRCFEASQKLAKLDGMVGYNINVANAIAAIFLATGQDMACIHESATGFLLLRKTKTGLLIELTLPNLVVGTVGGGTHLAKQSEALRMMGCLGAGKVERFAKLIAGFALGLEISTFAAIVSGEFAKAHEKLGRNKPKKWLLKSELNASMIEDCIKHSIDTSKLVSINFPDDDLLENGILTHIAGKTTKKLIGFIPLDIHIRNNVRVPLLIKSKALDEELIKGLHVIAASIDPSLSDLIQANKEHVEYKNAHIKELEVYEWLNLEGIKNIPTFYGKKVDIEREIYLLVQERMDYNQLRIIQSENCPELWKKEHIESCIEAITKIHIRSKDFKNENIRTFEPWKAAELYKKLLSIQIEELTVKKHTSQLKQIRASIDLMQQERENIPIPNVLVHNDFNSRNVAIRKDGCPLIYDWELAMWDLPHRDIVEFLCFTMTEDSFSEKLLAYLHYHHSFYPQFEWKTWTQGYRYALKVFLISRVSLYEVSGIVSKYEFSKRVLNNALKMLDFLQNE
ncbi:MAG: phosphotransferase [Leadbetterella sp.]